MFSDVNAIDLGWITRADMVEVDRAMIDDLGITLLQMMENAGRNLARVALDIWSPTTVTILAGSGGNGGGGMVAARHLHNAGVSVEVVATRSPETMSDAAGHQARILERMGVAIHDPTHRLAPSDLIVDAILGYSLDGAPRGVALEFIQSANTSSSDVLSLDTPSGLDVDDGTAPGEAVMATATMTLALAKVGLRRAKEVGQLMLADISVPRAVAVAVGATPPDFSPNGVLRITNA